MFNFRQIESAEYCSPKSYLLIQSTEKRSRMYGRNPTNTFRQKKSVEIIIETDNRYVRTSGYVESNEPNIFSSQEGTSISIICPDPFFYSAGEDGNNVTDFYSIDPMFEFPFSNESLTEPLLVFGDNSDQDGGCHHLLWRCRNRRNDLYSCNMDRQATSIFTIQETREVMKIDTVKLQKLTGKGIVASD